MKELHTLRVQPFIVVNLEEVVFFIMIVAYFNFVNRIVLAIEVKKGNDSFPTLFFLHGSPGSWDAFSVYMQDKDLLASYRMVSIDRQGFRYSQLGNAKNVHVFILKGAPHFIPWKPWYEDVKAVLLKIDMAN